MKNGRTVADVFDEIILEHLKKIRDEHDRGETMIIVSLEENKNLIMFRGSSVSNMIHDYFDITNINIFLDEVKSYFKTNFQKEIKENGKTYKYAIDYFKKLWGARHSKRRAKGYNTVGNIIYQKNEAVSTFKSNVTLEQVKEFYVKYYEDKFVADRISGESYDNDENKIRELFNEIAKNEVIYQFERIVIQNDRFFNSDKYNIHRRSGQAHLITFFNYGSNKTIHVNVGTFLFLQCSECDFQLHKAPKRIRTADRKERLDLVDKIFLTHALSNKSDL